MEINPDIRKSYNTERSNELEELYKRLTDNGNQITNKLRQIEGKLKRFFNGFDKEWEKKQKEAKAEDDNANKRNMISAVRLIKEHWIQKFTQRKTKQEEFMKQQQKELIKCKDDACKERVHKLIKWTVETTGNLSKSIEFFEKMMGEYMSEDEIKTVMGDLDYGNDDLEKDDMESEGDGIVPNASDDLTGFGEVSGDDFVGTVDVVSLEGNSLD